MFSLAGTLYSQCLEEYPEFGLPLICLKFVKIECYRRLIKFKDFKKASDHLEELKDELKGNFKDCELPRTKRLLDVESDGGETQASCPGKSTKCLQFDPINTTRTSNATANSSISTAISQQVGYYTPERFPIGSVGVSPIRSHPYGLVLQAFPSHLTVRPPVRNSSNATYLRKSMSL